MAERAQKISRTKRKPKRKKTAVQAVKGEFSEFHLGQTGTERTFAVFTVGKGWYAFDLDLVLEILHAFNLVSVPHLAELFSGVVYVREESIPVVDLRRLLKEDSHEPEVRTCLMTMVGASKIGFLVDSDPEIVDLKAGKFCPLPDSFSKEEADFIEGIFWLSDKFIGILNPLRALEVLGGWREQGEKV
ncbi:MAG: chemotaxis protein CheW [candidate division WOR-3 bacterium]|nr:MAG: chemotaxis protein CheW [candidate division WOR-3 bacterium]